MYESTNGFCVLVWSNRSVYVVFKIDTNQQFDFCVGVVH